MTTKKQVIHALRFTTHIAIRAALPFFLQQIVFCKDGILLHKSHEHFYFSRELGFPDSFKRMPEFMFR
jgi:hypothetical protein